MSTRRSVVSGVKRAAALRYEPGESAPFLLAKERGLLAERMESIAKEYGIEVVFNESLVDSLFLVETAEYIPEYPFKAVAALLAYTYRTRLET